METELRRINMATVGDLNQAVRDACNDLAQVGFSLRASFVVGNDLVLIFQDG